MPPDADPETYEAEVVPFGFTFNNLAQGVKIYITLQVETKGVETIQAKPRKNIPVFKPNPFVPDLDSFTIQTRGNGSDWSLDLATQIRLRII